MFSPLIKHLFVALFTVFLLPGIINAQKIIACTSAGSFISLDISNDQCQYSNINVYNTIDTLTKVPFSNALYKDTLYYNTIGGDIYRFVLGSTKPAVLLSHSTAFNTLTVDKNGVLYYLSSDNTLTTYNPHTNVIQPLGVVKFTPAGDLVFYNNKLILASFEGLVEININKPEESTLYMPTPGYSFYSLINVAVACNQNVIYGVAPAATPDSSALIEIDMINKKILGTKCIIPAAIYDAASITETGGYEGVTIDSILRTSCTGIADNAGIQVFASSAATDSLKYIFNNRDSNYTGIFHHLTNGVYPVTVQTKFGCKDDTTVHINTTAKIDVRIQAKNDNCFGDKGSIVLTNERTYSPVYVSLNSSPYSSNLSYTYLDTGTYFIRIKDTNYCAADTSVVIRYESINPQVNLGKDTALCFGQTISLKTYTYTNAAYLWQDGSTTPAYTVSKEGIYSLKVQTPCGSGSDSVNIHYYKCSCNFYVPTAFTPNHDGLNDRFTIHNKCYFTGFKLQVFNRMGQPVYESQNADAGWDGNLHGLPQPAGTYIWKINYLDFTTNQTVWNAGTVVLIR